MKHLFIFSMLLLSGLQIMAQNSRSTDDRFLHNGIYYTLDEATKEATVAPKSLDGNSKYDGEIVIDSVINVNGIDYIVTRIGESAFSGCFELKSFDIPNTIKIIEKEAFSYTPFSTFYVPKNVVKIGYRAFANCDNLEKIFLPESLTDISEGFIFGGDYNLIQINFPSQAAIDRLGNTVSSLTTGARLAKICIDGQIANAAESANVPLVISQKYGKFYWKKDKNGKRYLANEAGKTILPAIGWDKVWLKQIIVIKNNGKFGAYSYSGVKIVSPLYERYEGYGREGRLLFSNKTPNGVKCFVFTGTGKLLASRAFTNSQTYSLAKWIKDWMGFVDEF